MKYCRIIALAFCIYGCNERNKEPMLPEQSENAYSDYLYQYSVIDALLAGVYDGQMTFGELRKHGDFGIGSFNQLDGELLINENKIYKIRYDGSIQQVKDSDSTGIAFVKFFKADTILMFKEDNISYESLQKKIAALLPSNNLYGIRLTAKFSRMKARAPRPASKPYLPLKTYLSTGGQQNFEFQNISGVSVGFFLPPYMARTNVPGFHLHFISSDQKRGGHIFEFVTNEVRVEIDYCKGVLLEVNADPEFQKANLTTDREKELQEVE